MKKVVFFLAVALMSFAAKAQVTTFPLTEDFENALGNGWVTHSNDASNDNMFGRFNQSASYVHGGSYSFSFSSYNSATDYNQYLISPELILDPTLEYSFKFWYKGYRNTDAFRVLVSTTSNSPSAFTTVLANITSPATDWTELVYSLPAGTKYVAINYYANYQYYLFVDDIYIGVPTVPDVTIAGPDSASLNVQVNFTATSSATSFSWYVNGVQQTETGATFSHTFTTIGTYTVKVGATNAVGTSYDSIATTVINAPVTTFPWVESFENGIPTLFSLIDADGDGNNWRMSNAPRTGSYNITSDSYLSTALTPDNWMILPAFQLPASATDFVLSWWDDAQDPDYPADNYSVYVATSGTVAAFSATTAVYNGIPNADYSKRKVNIGTYAGQTIYVAFRHHNCTDMFRVNIDDIRIGAPELPELSISGPDIVAAGSAATYTATSDETTVFAWYLDGVVQSTTGSTFTTNITAGTHIIKVSTTNSAGTSVDSVATYGYSSSETTPRMTLFEHFTTAVCPNCPGAHTRLENIMGGIESQVAWVAHHVGYYTDNYTLPADETGIMGFYTGTSTFAPAMLLDRDPDNVPGEYNGIVGGVTTNTTTLLSQFNNAISKHAFVTVGLQNVTYNANSRQVSFDVNGTFIAPITGDVRLTVYITEDSLISTQSGASGNYRHDHVLRGVITDYWGDALASTGANDTYSKHYTYTLPATWNYTKCRLTAFVNKYSSSFSDRKVLNATKSGFLTSTLGVENVKPAISVKMWPNPVAEMAFVEAESSIRSYVVVNALGQRVMGAEGINVSALELNVSGLAAGVYFVSVTTDNGVSTERLSVVK